mgnify:CR=1 FL=1|tara:strand:- start:233 stop:835 length:603 start_codon:yes stop_codon:yes gene_type:complete
MIKVEPYECYKEYLAIKRHFQSPSYDYFDYKGRIRTSRVTFSKRKDQYLFTKLSKNYKDEEIKTFFVANFVDNENFWITDTLTEQAEISYRDWQKRIQSLSYMFTNDIDKLLDEHEFDELFEIKHGQHPKLLRFCLAKYIMIETFIILNALVNFVPRWDKQIFENIVWPVFRKKAQKYTPFLEVDKTKFRDILRRKLDIV